MYFSTGATVGRDSGKDLGRAKAPPARPVPDWAWRVDFRRNGARPQAGAEGGLHFCDCRGTQRLEKEGRSFQPCTQMVQIRDPKKKEQESNTKTELQGLKMNECIKRDGPTHERMLHSPYAHSFLCLGTFLFTRPSRHRQVAFMHAREGQLRTPNISLRSSDECSNSTFTRHTV